MSCGKLFLHCPFAMKGYLHSDVAKVSVVEIETAISEHPDVLAVGVVAVPNPETTSMARAYIVLKPGKSLKEEDILEYVAGKVVFYKQLHGGATFVNSLPMNSGGKLDRRSLYSMAMAEIKQ
ncbi:hypothetical protein J437_LFUL005544 [Ladona fulva]|uniref:AMP-binding enzyme C-terminal domain-containing protein n=1 Tax=Ladona fulva TaxID=123851 RepID=A0A8K0JYI8_LADFU|nr:hypothetical protein J437_LFUL005544 [Ladona fulva]